MKSAEAHSIQAEEIVSIGSLDPMQIHLPGIFVDRIVPATSEKQIEFLTLRPEPGSPSHAGELGSGEAARKREMIAKVECVVDDSNNH